MIQKTSYRFLKKMREVSEFIRLENGGISFVRPVPVVEGRLIIFCKRHYSRRGAVRYRCSVRFLVMGKTMSRNKLENADYSVFTVSKDATGFRIVLPVWKLDDPEYSEGKHFFVIFLLNKLKMKPYKGEARLSFKSDEALFRYNIDEDGVFECEIEYMPDLSNPSTCGACVEIINLGKIKTCITVGESTAPFFSKRYKANLLPEVDRPKVLIIYFGSLYYDYMKSRYLTIKGILDALNLEASTILYGSNKIELRFILKRKYRRDIVKRKIVELRVLGEGDDG